jgi:hypothetical protein
MTPDGSRIWFRSSDALTDQDTDTNRIDLYERAGGVTTLVSPANGVGEPNVDIVSFSGASTKGDIVFFDTLGRLTADDIDTGRRDVYRFAPPAPLASTGAASGVSPTAATLNGSVTPNGLAASYHFEYGITAAYGAQTLDQSAGLGDSAAAVSQAIGGLAASTTYHFRVVATTAIGQAVGGDVTFTTQAGPGGGGGVQRDVTAPVIGGVKVKPRSVKRGKRATVSFTLSEAASVKLTVARKSAGRKVRGKCVKPTRKNRRQKRCSRFVTTKTVTVAAKAGANQVRLPKLNAGSYRITLDARDAAGNKASPRRVTLEQRRR